MCAQCFRSINKDYLLIDNHPFCGHRNNLIKQELSYIIFVPILLL